MRKLIGRLGMVVALAGFASAAQAHGGHAHVMGTVTAVDASHIEVKGKDGKATSLKVDDKTAFKNKDKSAAKAADVSVGQRVMIDTEGEGDAVAAREVMLGAKPKAKAPKATKPAK